MLNANPDIIYVFTINISSQHLLLERVFVGQETQHNSFTINIFPEPRVKEYFPINPMILRCDILDAEGWAVV